VAGGWDEPDGETERRFKLLSALFAGYNICFVRAIDRRETR
jgi:hypothetical protein